MSTSAYAKAAGGVTSTVAKVKVTHDAVAKRSPAATTKVIDALFVVIQRRVRVTPTLPTFDYAPPSVGKSCDRRSSRTFARWCCVTYVR